MEHSAINSGAFLLVLGAILYIGVISTYLYEKFKIPDVLNLILIGIILGPIFHIIDPALLADWMPLVGAIALGLILFEGGLDLDLDAIIERFGLSFLLSTGTFVLNVILIAVAYRFFVQGSWIHSLLLGSTLGCVSSAVILPISMTMNISEKLKTTINLEAALSDMWGVVLTIVLLRLAVSPEMSPAYGFNAIVGAFVISVIAALVFGMAWLWILDRFKESAFAYMMTLAAVFVLYGLTELVHGSGPLAALAFGVVLANGDRIAQIFRKKFKFELDDKIRQFNTEVTFFVRTFFFVYLGLVVSFQSLDRRFFYMVGLVFLIILIIRFVVIQLGLRFFSRKELQNKQIYIAMLPRGLTSAVLVGIVQSQISGLTRFIDYAFAIILLTNILMTWWVWRIEKAHQDKAPKPA